MTCLKKPLIQINKEQGIVASLLGYILISQLCFTLHSEPLKSAGTLHLTSIDAESVSDFRELYP